MSIKQTVLVVLAYASFTIGQPVSMPIVGHLRARDPCQGKLPESDCTIVDLDSLSVDIPGKCKQQTVSPTPLAHYQINARRIQLTRTACFIPQIIAAPLMCVPNAVLDDCVTDKVVGDSCKVLKEEGVVIEGTCQKNILSFPIRDKSQVRPCKGTLADTFRSF